MWMPLLLVATVPAQSGMVPFVIPWDDQVPNTATDVSFLNAMPAGKNGWVRVKGGHWIESKTGQRVRFLATNMVAGAAFPLKQDADKIAGRLAKHGINLVRFHHLQNNWDTEGGMIWKKDRVYFELDPVQVDKLDYFVAALKKKGIYSNINLQTTRMYLPEMGLPGSVTSWKQNFGKKLDKIWPRMVELQKEYAKALLDRKNRYTGLKYSQDPAILKIEINNENSMVGWPGESPGAGLDGLPEPFKAYLQTSWNNWLTRKYKNSDALRATWAKGTTPLGGNLLGSNNAWTWENQSGADVDFTPGAPKGGSRPITVNVKSVKGPDWHIQAHLPGLDLKEGGAYTIQFRAKSSVPRGFGLTVNLDRPDWHNAGLSAGAQTTPEWKDYAFTFTARNVDPGHLRIAFVLGGSTGEVTIENISLRPGRISPNLLSGESLEAKSVGLPAASMTPQGIDYATFLAQFEANYSNSMRNYLRDKLGFKNTNIIDSQIAWGGASALIRESKMEYADNHAYWQHPVFTGGDWDPKNWFVNRVAMVNEMDKGGGELGNMARSRIGGKPYSISEYDHPAPNGYMAEMMPLFATVGAAQDWDALYTFDYGVTGTGRPNSQIQSFFSQCTNPAKFGFYSASALLFRKGQIEPLSRSTQLVVPSDPIKFGFQWSDLWANRAPNVLQSRMSVKTGLTSSPKLQMTGTKGSAFKVRDGAGGKILTVDSPKAKALVGFIRGQSTSLSGFAATFPANGPEFASLTLTPCDGRVVASSNRMLLTAVGRVENTNMGWSADRRTVSDKWGTGPTMIEVIPMSLRIKTSGPRRVWELDGSGKRVRQVKTSYTTGQLSFSTAGGRTMWWEIVD